MSANDEEKSGGGVGDIEAEYCGSVAESDDDEDEYCGESDNDRGNSCEEGVCNEEGDAVSNTEGSSLENDGDSDCMKVNCVRINFCEEVDGRSDNIEDEECDGVGDGEVNITGKESGLVNDAYGKREVIFCADGDRDVDGCNEIESIGESDGDKEEDLCERDSDSNKDEFGREGDGENGNENSVGKIDS